MSIQDLMEKTATIMASILRQGEEVNIVPSEEGELKVFLELDGQRFAVVTYAENGNDLVITRL